MPSALLLGNPPILRRVVVLLAARYRTKLLVVELLCKVIDEDAPLLVGNEKTPPKESHPALASKAPI